mmetsp:Transcript_6180/g.18693  ORF Transcript_6180/g.18693 Transcript_6180/m.18693 type:complete len:743 (+) Transcript_6180:105-2333(+)
MVAKERPNRVIREYGKASRTGVVLVKKRNPTLSASQWKKRALGLYGTVLVMSEVGPEEQVTESDHVTEELELPRSAQVVVHSVLGMPCVCVETSKYPLVFRPLDVCHGHVLQDWAEAIRAAVIPPDPGALDPLLELQALVTRKDITTAEAQRVQTLMRSQGSSPANGPKQPCMPTYNLDTEMTSALAPQEEATSATLRRQLRLHACRRHDPDSVHFPHSLGVGEALFGEADSVSQAVQLSGSPSRSEGTAGVTQTSRASCSESDAQFAQFPAACSVDGLVPMGCVEVCTSTSRCAQGSLTVLSNVYTGVGKYFGYIASNGACINSHGACIGYLNDLERTAGSSKGEYLGCVSAPRRGESFIESPTGEPLAMLDVGRAKLRTLAGSTVAEFKITGDVVTDLGLAICRFESLSINDQPTMALYLSFVAPSLLHTAATRAQSGIELIDDAVVKSSLKPCDGADVVKAVPDSKLADRSDSEGWLNVPVRSFNTSGVVMSNLKTADNLAMTSEPRFPSAEAKTFHGTDLSGAMKRPAHVGLQTQITDSEDVTTASSGPDSHAHSDTSHPGDGHAMSEVGEARVTKQTANSAGRGMFYHVAIADFVADIGATWQLTISKGMLCTIVEDHGDGWSTIQLQESGSRGAIPTAFIETVSEIDRITAAVLPCSQVRQGDRSSTKSSAPHLRTVAHAFVAEDESWQVSITANESVEHVEDHQDGWSEIIKPDGIRGFVPTDFLLNMETGIKQC